jgi:ribosome-binding factor A
MHDVKLSRLTHLVHRRVSEVILYELQDPRLGFLTVTRVDLSRDLRHATVYWSIVGSEGDRSKTAHALEHARGRIQGEVARVMKTRVTPILRFEYDESVEGSVRVSRILEELRQERGESEEGRSEEE